MISTKKLIKMAKKWQRIAIASRKRVSWPRPVANEGHFVVYTTDGRRFMIPLTYLNTDIFRELLRMAEEEFGTSSSGPITLPCDSGCMEYIISMIQKHVAKDLENALIASLSSCRYSSLVEDQQQSIYDSESHTRYTSYAIIYSCLIDLPEDVTRTKPCACIRPKELVHSGLSFSKDSASGETKEARYTRALPIDENIETVFLTTNHGKRTKDSINPLLNDSIQE